MQGASLFFLLAIALLLALTLVDLWFDILSFTLLLKIIVSIILVAILWWVLIAILRNLNADHKRD